MIGLDGTDASKRAFQMLVGHILKPSDYVYLVASAFLSASASANQPACVVIT
jgi:hypothetical protein